MDKHIVEELNELSFKINSMNERVSVLLAPKDEIAQITGTQLHYLIIQNSLWMCGDTISGLLDMAGYLKDKSEKEIQDYFLSKKDY